MSVSVTIRLDDEIARAIDDEADRSGRSRGRVIRDAVLDHLKRKGSPSALDALAKYVGIVDGPPDLSTNKAYLADMGARSRRKGKARK